MFDNRDRCQLSYRVAVGRGDPRTDGFPRGIASFSPYMHLLLVALFPTRAFNLFFNPAFDEILYRAQTQQRVQQSREPDLSDHRVVGGPIDCDIFDTRRVKGGGDVSPGNTH